jgi:hypothetical protein
VSGALAARSCVSNPTPGPLAATADVLARSTQLRASEARRRRPRLTTVKQTAFLLAAAAGGDDSGAVVPALLLRRLRNTVEALRDAHLARGEVHRAWRSRWRCTALDAVRAALPVPTGPPMRPATRTATPARVRPRATVALRYFPAVPEGLTVSLGISAEPSWRVC